MRISELVNDETWVKLMLLADKLEQSKKKPQPVQQKNKSREQLSKRELHHLMGVNRNTYYKCGGKIKQR